MFFPTANSLPFWDNFGLWSIGDSCESDASVIDAEFILLAAELVEAEAKTLGLSDKFGQFVLSLCLLSNSWCGGMFGETGSLVGVFVPGCRLSAASGDVAGDGFREDELVLEK